MGETVTVTFVPQKEETSYGETRYVEDDQMERVSFDVPFEDAVDDAGNMLEIDTYASDSLRYHENSPRKVRDEDHPEYHQGPFYMIVGE